MSTLPATVRSGLDQLPSAADVLARLKGRRVGLVTNPTGVTSNLRSAIDVLRALPEIHLSALFGPEHGIRGDAQAGAPVQDTLDARTGLPSFSLYGETRKPTAAMLNLVDAFVVDLQDGGVRFYTYLYTLAYVMQAAAEAQMPVVVLDRPAPLGGLVSEGPVLRPELSSFVGLYPISVRPGLTVGELAKVFNTVFGIGADLTIVPMAGWRRGMWFDQTGLPWVIPSPNLPTLTSLNCFVGTCLIEGTSLSEGRGTTQPFELIGGPGVPAEDLAATLNALELPGVRFRPAYFTPVISKHSHQLCAGVQIYVLDRHAFQPIQTTLHLLRTARTLAPDGGTWRVPTQAGTPFWFDRLIGNPETRPALDAGQPIEEIAASWQTELREFEKLRAGVMMYQT